MVSNILSIYDLLLNLVFILLITLIVAFITYLYNEYKVRQLLPPGPLGIPLVGYQPFFGKDLHKVVTKLGEKYGSVFTYVLHYIKVLINTLI